jgi:hypothetical protein
MDVDLGLLGPFYRAKYFHQVRALGLREPPERIEWARIDMAVDELLREMLVIGADQPDFALSIAKTAARDEGIKRKQYLRRRLQIAEKQVLDGAIMPLWRRFADSSDPSVSFLYPEPNGQVVDAGEGFVTGLEWANDGGQSAMIWGLNHPREARSAFEIPRRLRARIERLSSIAVDFDVEAALAQQKVDYILREYGRLP